MDSSCQSDQLLRLNSALWRAEYEPAIVGTVRS